MPRRVTVLCCLGLVLVAGYSVFRDQLFPRVPAAAVSPQSQPDELIAYFEAGSEDLLIVSGRPAELIQFREAYIRGLRPVDDATDGSIRHLTQDRAHERNNATYGKMLFRAAFLHPVNGEMYQHAIQQAMQETGCRFVQENKVNAGPP